MPKLPHWDGGRGGLPQWVHSFGIKCRADVATYGPYALPIALCSLPAAVGNGATRLDCGDIGTCGGYAP